MWIPPLSFFTNNISAEASDYEGRINFSLKLLLIYFLITLNLFKLNVRLLEISSIALKCNLNLKL